MPELPMNALEDVDFRGKRALVRVDFNVPLDEEQHISDDTRIEKALPTIQYILDQGGSVILMSHLGRPKGTGPEPHLSLRHIRQDVARLLGRQVRFIDDCVGEEVASAARTLQQGDVLLLENLRFYKEETAGDVDFARSLSQLGDVYVNDAFGTAHRAHASTAVIGQFYDDAHKVFGKLMASEIEHGQKLLKTEDQPFVAILGGAKVSDKINIISNLITKADHLIIGGGMTYTFIKALGGDIGKSILEEDKVALATGLIDTAQQSHVQLHLPEDSVIADAFKETANTKIAESSAIPDDWMGLDIGPKACRSYSEVIASAKVILWNGPMGVFEMAPFAKGTETVAKAVAEATKKGAYSLVGGGDSVAAINHLGLSDDISYVSTGGGAMLEFLEGKVLPGIKAISG